MLLNLKVTHKPTTIAEAAAFLQQPKTYPLYGGAALQRSSLAADVEAAVDLSQLDLDYIRDSESSLRLGTMLTLEQVRQACLERAEQHPRIGGIAAVLKEDFPETLRNTLRLGDLLMERNPQSLTITALLALGGVIKRADVDMHFTLSAWLTGGDNSWRYLLAQVRLMRGPQRAAFAYEKVSRTPADAPIVAAVAYAEANDSGKPCYTALALCGVAPFPIPQPHVVRTLDETGDLNAALSKLQLDPPDDHWGSREYRTEMARVVTRRALGRVLEEAKSK